MFRLFEMRFPRPNCPGPGAGLRRSLGRSACALLAAVVATGCASPSSNSSGDTPPLEDIVVYHRAESDLAKQLGIEVNRLRADLRRAEEALIEVESGLRGSHTRANAVSAIAETRILVKRTARQAPWRTEESREAESKLAEADRQVQQNNPGAALFFVYAPDASPNSGCSRPSSSTSNAIPISSRAAGLICAPDRRPRVESFAYS